MVGRMICFCTNSTMDSAKFLMPLGASVWLPLPASANKMVVMSVARTQMSAILLNDGKMSFHRKMCDSGGNTSSSAIMLMSFWA
jgi:hypothetical protein